MELVHEYACLKLSYQIRKFEYVCLLEQRTGVLVKFTKGYCPVGSFNDQRPLLINASYLLDAPLLVRKLNKRPGRLIDHLRYFQVPRGILLYMRYISKTPDWQARNLTIFLKLELTMANLIFGSMVLKSGILFKTTSNQRAAPALRNN